MLLIIAIMTALSAIALVTWGLFLRLGLFWTRTQGATAWRIVQASVLALVTQLVVGVLLAWGGAMLLEPSLVAAAVVGVVAIALLASVACWSIHSVFMTGPTRSFFAWLPTLFPMAGTLLFGSALVGPYFYQAFKASTNSMAPTILGEHWRTVCPVCGSPPVDPIIEDFTETAICEKFHVTSLSERESAVYPGDRVLVDKFSTPRRWDLVAFRVPSDPSTVFVMRLVGLPGETIHIENGAVWADGKRLPPPTTLAGVEYISEFDFNTGLGELWGTRDRPAKLAEDEYFVLGDFSARAMDSRLWRSGAKGHAPYVVPKSHLLGPVRFLYWPHERWRDFRK